MNGAQGQVDWYPTRPEAIEHKTEWAKMLVGLGYQKDYGVIVRPKAGGYAILVEPH